MHCSIFTHSFPCMDCGFARADGDAQNGFAVLISQGFNA